MRKWAIQVATYRPSYSELRQTGAPNGLELSGPAEAGDSFINVRQAGGPDKEP